MTRATEPHLSPVPNLTRGSDIHLYPRFMPYRKSGMEAPQPGDMAYCGHVISASGARVRPAGSTNCLMCLRLYEALSK